MEYKAIWKENLAVYQKSLFFQAPLQIWNEKKYIYVQANDDMK